MTFPQRLLWLALLVALMLMPGRGLSFRHPVHDELPDLDRRHDRLPKVKAPTPAHMAEVQKLKSQVPGLRIEQDEIRASPKHIASTRGFLTGPKGEGKSVSPARVQKLPASDPHRSIKAFVDEHAGLFGHDSGALKAARLRKDFTNRRNGVRSILWEQQVDDIPVFEGVMLGHLTAQGELASLSSHFIADPIRAADLGTPNRAALRLQPAITALQAVIIAADNLGEALLPVEVRPLTAVPQGPELRQGFKAGTLPDVAEVRLTWLPLDESSLRLCWEVALTRHAGGERHRLLVDAQTGEIWMRHRLTVYLQAASYRVYTGDSPTPRSPSWSSPTNTQPPVVPRELITLAALDTNASPLGWIADGENQIRGNNVDAHLDRNADNEPDLPRPQGTPFRVFDPVLDLAQPPSTYGEAAAVNLFYWCNWIHDRLYQLGFDEASGNFQKDNLGRGGLGSDAIQADAQDGSGVNNANFTPSPDGVPGRIQMFVFTGPEPDRDGDLDTEIIIHEYVHGLTTRLVGGGIGISALQTGGMGEGWSDFYALALLSQPGDDLDGTYAFGAYASRLFANLHENYYFGIRRYPYSTDLTKAPLTFKDIDSAQISSHPGVPVSPIFGFQPLNAAEVHNSGEIWCSALWEARANVIRKHGFTVGNELILRLVTDGLKLAPPNPNFLQARDAIILADQIATGGENYHELWAGFAKRGMGFSAQSPDSNYASGIVEAFDLPDSLLLLDPAAFISGGPLGGPFVPGCKSYLLTNISEVTVGWTVRGSQPWISIAPASGTLAPHARTNVAICINDAASQLPYGTFADLIVFSNTTTRVTQRRTAEVRLQEFASLPFTDGFESGRLEPWWTFTGKGPRNASVNPQNVPHSGNLHLTLDAVGGGVSARNEVTLGLDLGGYTNVVLQFWAKQFSDEPDGPPRTPFTDAADFDGVAISEDGVLWFEVQSLRGIPASYTNFTVNLDDAIRRFGLSYSGRFRVRINQYDNFQIPFDGLAIDDVSVTGIPFRRLSVQMPPEVPEDAGVLTNRGLVLLGSAATMDLVVALVSSDAGRLRVPAKVTIPAGARSALFDLTLIDNDVLDGSHPAVISASVAGYFSSSRSILVHDDDTAKLKVKLPKRAREGDGILKKGGQVSIKEKVSRDIAVSLAVSPAGKISVPTSVFIPAGKKDADFDIVVLDDRLLDGKQRVTVTAHVTNWTDDSEDIDIEDNDKPALQMKLPASVAEVDGVMSNAGSIALSAALPTNLVVTLASSDTSELLAPVNVTIPAWTLEAQFALTAVDDNSADGAQPVKITASAPGFPMATASLTVLDDETPPAPYDPVPLDGEGNVSVSLRLSWSSGVGEVLRNGGFETGDFSQWTVQEAGFGAWQINDGMLDPDGPGEKEPPRAGKYDAVTTQFGAGRHTLSQEVFLPPSAQSATLSWWDRIQNHATYFQSPNQEFRVQIRTLDDQLLATAYSTQEGDPLNNPWTNRAFNLSPFRGQAVRVLFEQDDNLGYFNTRLDDVSVMLGSSGGTTTFDVYFGTAPDPGAAQFLGNTTNTSWTVPPLALNTLYYWQVVTRRGSASTAGPVWQFTTRGVGGLHHFDWTPIASPQQAGRRFAVAITAKDEINNTIKKFTGPVTVAGLPGSASASSIVVTEIDVGTSDATEFMNISSVAVDMTGWTISVYDSQSFPAPLTSITLPVGSVCPPLTLFRLNEFGVAPGKFPTFLTGTNANWSSVLPAGNPIAVLVRDAAGAIVDFVCAADADPGRITSPVTIPREQWLGNPLRVDATTVTMSLQRVGGADHNDASDWATAPLSLGAVNAQLSLPFASRTIPVTPHVLSNFVAGVWSGFLTVMEPVARVTLRAESGANFGLANEIAVGASNDVAITVAGGPDRALVGTDVEWKIIVTNTGPLKATGVVVTNWLPNEVEFVSAATFNGVCTNAGRMVVCDFGTLFSNDRALATIFSRATNAGAITNIAVVRRNEADAYLSNNTSLAALTLNYPAVSSTNVTINERTGVNVTAGFLVRLGAPSPLPLSLDYFTSDGTAVAEKDYVATNGTLYFPPGMTSQVVSVVVLGDNIDESLETLFLNLVNPTNCTIATPQVRCRILDDDPTPALSIDSVTVMEGPPSGTNTVVFRVRLSAPSSLVVTVGYSTSDGTAQANVDYLPVFGSLSFSPGTTNLPLTVAIRGDDAFESAEIFFLNLFSPFAAVLPNGRGTATILDDDAGELDRFVWGPVPSPQYAGVPFMTALTAVDGLNRKATNFNGPVFVQTVANSREASIGTGTNLWEQPLGAFFHDSRAQVVYRPEEIGTAGQITALALHIASLPGQTLSNWTIRLKHSAQRSYGAAPAWESNGWATVYRRDETLLSTGWLAFVFASPFAYNGTDALLVDFSFNNGSYSVDGLCRSTMTADRRSISAQTDSAFGDPLFWNGTNRPAPVTANFIPNARFTLEDAVQATPEGVVQLVEGIFSGAFTVFDARSNVVLRAFDGLGRIASSVPFSVDSAEDVDGDGLPDAWEYRFFGGIGGGSVDDSDGDGITNRDEFLGGTDPMNATSATRIVRVQMEGDDVCLFFTSVTGKAYRIESAEEMTAGKWTPVVEEVSGNGGIAEARHRAGFGARNLFYRVRVLP
jgi:uncharacterized repeat protein (TIGR01451 family)